MLIPEDPRRAAVVGSALLRRSFKTPYRSIHLNDAVQRLTMVKLVEAYEVSPKTEAS